MSNQGPLPTVVSSTEIVERIAASLNAKGLQKTQEYFEGMEHLLSGLACWGVVKTKADELFAAERKRLEELELARAEAAAAKVYQFMPGATTGVTMNNTQFGGSMYEIKDNQEVKFGDSNNGEEDEDV
ncbi:MAG: hypothetical protein J5502_05820 [Prevotella sp.]|nr:hypothetical protein [Prevotella sp.]